MVQGGVRLGGEGQIPPSPKVFFFFSLFFFRLRIVLDLLLLHEADFWSVLLEPYILNSRPVLDMWPER